MSEYESNCSSAIGEQVRAISELQEKIGKKLKDIHYLNGTEDDFISHHLAEVSYLGVVISSRLVPSFLQAEGKELADITVDLFEDLREIKEAIMDMEEQFVGLMNYVCTKDII
jgi:hypothetical protein